MSEWRVSLHRKIADRERYTHVPTKVVFFHLVLLANHEPHKRRGQQICRWERITSIWHIAEETWCTFQQVRTALKNLEKTWEITRRSTNKNTLITLLKYDVYQSEDWRATSKSTNKQQTNNNQSTTNNNDKNEKNEKKKKVVKKFTPPTLKQVVEYCDQRENDVDPHKFINFYQAKGRMVWKNSMKDRKASVRTRETPKTTTPRKKKDIPTASSRKKK